MPVLPPQSPQAAQTVVERYYHEIERRDFRAAYREWHGRGPAAHQTAASFAEGFARTAHVCVVTRPPVDQEGAAGSTFITVPVEVRATLTDGTRQRFVGTFALRHVNDVPGATVAERRWHLESASLRPA